MRRPPGNRPAYGLAALLGTAGISHLVAPGFYRPLIPAALGSPDPWVYGSGMAELACAGFIAVPKTRRVGAYAAAVLFAAVFPGNVKMALDAGGRSTAYRAAAYLRLPLQVPLVTWALAVGRASSARTASRPPR